MGVVWAACIPYCLNQDLQDYRIFRIRVLVDARVSFPSPSVVCARLITNGFLVDAQVPFPVLRADVSLRPSHRSTD